MRRSTRGAAHTSEHPEPVLASLLERCEAEDRLNVTWSEHDLRMALSLAHVNDERERYALAARFHRNAIFTARHWLYEVPGERRPITCRPADRGASLRSPEAQRCSRG